MADPGGTGPSPQDTKNAQELNEVLREVRDTLISVGAAFKTELTDQIDDLVEAEKNAAKIIAKDFVAGLNNAAKVARQSQITQTKMNGSLKTQASIEKQIDTIKTTQSSLTNDLIQMQLQGIQLTAAQTEKFNDAQQALLLQLGVLKEQLDISKKLGKQAEATQGLFMSISKIPILGPLLGMEKVMKKVNKAAEEGKSSMQQFGIGVDQAFKNIGSGLILGAITKIFTFTIESVVQFDKKAFEIAKNLGITVGEAKKLQSVFQDVAISSKNIALLSKDVAATYGQMSESLGFMGPTNKEFLESTTLIQKRLGLSADSMDAIATQSALSGKSFMSVYKTVQATRLEEGAKNKLMLSAKQIIDGMAKTSKAVLINFRGSDAALGAAIIRATKLGTTLDNINKQGESLIDFESSISREFEAQVLTGKNINLTRARELALMGDTRGLMEELNKQNVDLGEYQNMNLIQRKAFADAIGLSTDELSKQLIEQDKAKKLGAEQGVSAQEQYKLLLSQKKTREEIAELVGKDAEADLNKASKADAFQATIERLKDTIGEMLQGPVGGLIDKFTAFVNDGEKMKMIGEKLKQIFSYIGKAIERFPQILSSAVEIAKVLATVSIVRAVASMVGSLSAVPVVGAAAGLIAGAATYSWLNGLLSGGGGGAPSATTPAAPTQETVSPMNSNAAMASQAASAKESEKKRQPIFNLQNTTIVGTEKWDSQTRNSLSESPGTWAQ